MQRKVFRVESIFAPKGAAASAAARHGAANELNPPRIAAELPADDRDDGETVQSLKAELAHIRDTIAQHKRDLGGLIGDGQERRMARATSELGAAVDSMETATDKILKSAETIDESARALTATLQDKYKRGLAQEIQEHVVQIFESCNFQDVAGQRIGNVIAMLATIEEQVAAMLARCNNVIAAAPPPAANKVSPARALLNGPKLDGDPGHTTQRDIDRMFG